VNTKLSSRWWAATVTRPAYANGTRVLLSSFLRHTPWFTGTLAVIHDTQEPPSEVVRSLPDVLWQPASDELAQSLTATGRPTWRRRPVDSTRSRPGSRETFFNHDHQRALNAWDDEAVRCLPWPPRA